MGCLELINLYNELMATAIIKREGWREGRQTDKPGKDMEYKKHIRNTALENSHTTLAQMAFEGGK